MAWVFMAELQHVNIHCQAQCRVRWSGVKHTTTRLWSSGNVVCGVMNHISLFGTMMDKSGLANVRRTLPAGVSLVLEEKCYGIVFLVSFDAVRRNVNASAYRDIYSTN